VRRQSEAATALWISRSPILVPHTGRYLSATDARPGSKAPSPLRSAGALQKRDLSVVSDLLMSNASRFGIENCLRRANQVKRPGYANQPVIRRYLASFLERVTDARCNSDPGPIKI